MGGGDKRLFTLFMQLRNFTTELIDSIQTAPYLFMEKTAQKHRIYSGIEVKYISNNLYPLGSYYLWLIRWD